MAQDPDGIFIAGTTTLYVAEPGAPLPEHWEWDPDSAPEYSELGYTETDGFKFTDGKTIRESKVAQDFYAVRRSVTERTCEAAFSLKEWNALTLAFAFGGTVEPAGSGGVLLPPEAGELDERTLVARSVDGYRVLLFVFPLGIVTSNVEASFNRENDALLPITFGAVKAADQPIYMIFSNDLVPQS